jgi:hypothetical protein
MNAKAQAWKRTGRWHGPGQCLYGTEDFLIFRGEEPGQLRVPKAGDKPHRRPYITKECERVIREQYEAWLKEEGQATYGSALNHQEAFEAIAERIKKGVSASHTTVTPHAKTSRQASSEGNGRPTTASILDDDKDDARSPDVGAAPVMQTSAAAQDRPTFTAMPDHPAPPAVVKAAEICGFGEPLARALSNLVRPEGEDAKTSKQQVHQAIASWLSTLHRLGISEGDALNALSYNAAKAMSQESRQAIFTRWLARKATGETDEQPTDTPAADAANGQPHEDPASREDPEDRRAALTRAIGELQRKMREHGYEDRPVTRFAALATGGGPRTQVDWGTVDPNKLLVLSDLLDSAARIGWTNEQLEQAVIAAHNSSRQTSIAGRFSALANHIADLAARAPQAA